MALCTTVQQDDSHVIHDYMLVRAVHALRAVRAVGVMGVVCAVGGPLLCCTDWQCDWAGTGDLTQR